MEILFKYAAKFSDNENLTNPIIFATKMAFVSIYRRNNIQSTEVENACRLPLVMMFQVTVLTVLHRRRNNRP